MAIVALLCRRANQSIALEAAVSYLFSMFNHSIEKFIAHSKAFVWVSPKDAAGYND